MFIADELTNTTAGLVGEHIAAAAILQRGWSASLSQQDGFDIIATRGRENYRVQVKACSLSHRPGKKSLQFLPGIGRNKRLPTMDDWDILCVVSAETRAALFLPIVKVNSQKLTKSISLFTPENEADSWDQTIEVIRHEYSKSPPVHYTGPRIGPSSNRELSPHYW